MNRPFPSCFEPHQAKAKCTAFIVKISSHSYANKSSFKFIQKFKNLEKKENETGPQTKVIFK